MRLFLPLFPPIVALKSSPADRNGGQDQCRAQFSDGLDLQEGEFLLQVILVVQSLPIGQLDILGGRLSGPNPSKSL